MNAHQTIYVITRSTPPAARSSCATICPHGQGQARADPGCFHHHRLHRAGCDRAINYYGGTVAGLSAIFATATECLGIPVTSIFDPSNLPDYASFDSRECPMCKAGQHIDALVNSFGYSAL